MTENHTSQQKIQNNQTNDVTSKLTSIPGVEEVNEADLEGVDGGRRWCPTTRRWIDDPIYHMIDDSSPSSMTSSR